MASSARHIQVTLPDGTSRRVPEGTAAGDALTGPGGSLPSEVLALFYSSRQFGDEHLRILTT